MSGGNGPGGYPGQGYGAPGYDGDRRRSGRRRQQGGAGGGRQQGGRQQGARQEESGSVWEADHGFTPYEGQPGYDGQDYDGDPRYGQGYRDPAYRDPAYDDPRHDPRDQGRPGGPAHPSRGQGSGGYRQQDVRPQDTRGRGAERRQGTRRQDTGRYQDTAYSQDTAPRQGQFDGTGPRRAASGYDQRGDNGYNQNRYDDREQDQGDNSFLPGFSSRGDNDAPRAGSRAPARDDRYDYDDPRGPGRGRPANLSPADLPPADLPAKRPRHPGRPSVGPGDRGGPRPDPRDAGNAPRDDDAYDDYDAWDDRDRKPRKKATRWFPRILILTVVAVLLVGGLVGGLKLYHSYENRYHPPDYAGPGAGSVTVQVMSGDTAFSLAPRLLQLGVIASTRAFENAATAATSSTGLEAGYYQLHEHMQASLAYAALTNPKNLVQTTVTIPEGKRAVDVIAIIAAKTKIPLKDFQQVLANPSQLGLPSYADGKVEGYLFPATYAVVPHETALQILQAMVQRFNVEAQQVNLVSAAKAINLTPTKVIIEASLAQAEGGSVSDYPKIAEVINNRLASGMHLQFDSTVLYGLGKYAVSATFKQINTPGPYNTYLNAGLPAGPISNPGNAAIQAVLSPDHGNFLYFLTKPGGASQFSATPLQGQ